MGKSKSLDTDNPPESGTLVKNCLEGDPSHSEKARDLELNKVLLWSYISDSELLQSFVTTFRK